MEFYSPDSVLISILALRVLASGTKRYYHCKQIEFAPLASKGDEQHLEWMLKCVAEVVIQGFGAPKQQVSKEPLLFFFLRIQGIKTDQARSSQSHASSNFAEILYP